MGWHRRAACADEDPDLLFPQTEEQTAAALAVCARCSVVNECFDDTVDWETRHAAGDPDGVRAGMTAAQRKPLIDALPRQEPPQVTRVRRMAGKRMPDREIGAVEGISPDMVKKIRDRAGIQAGTPRPAERAPWRPSLPTGVKVGAR